MEIWDKVYKNITTFLGFKKNNAQNLWAISLIIESPSLKIVFLNLWRLELQHAINLNKLLQSLGYAQIKLTEKTNVTHSDIWLAIEEIITGKEKWLSLLEETTRENFGNEIHYTFLEIMADDIVSIEVLKELINKHDIEND